MECQRCFENLYKRNGEKVSLESDILEKWKSESAVSSKLIDDVRKSFKYRHWLAHGRYWTAKNSGQEFDYPSLCLLSQLVLISFPFEK